MNTSLIRSRPTGHRSGFSLIEILGVLSIIAVLALVLTPNMVGEIDRAAHLQEAQALRRIALGLEQHVVQHRTIPDHGGWVEAVASETGESPSWVTANPRGGSRVLLIDPRFGVGPAGTNRPPYAQTHEGSTQVVNPRYLILSSMGAPLPVTVTSGFAGSATEFDELWNLVDGTKPASWSWAGVGADLKLQRVDLTPKFHHLTLNSVDLLPGRYAVDASAVAEVTRSPISFFLLEGSILSLVGTDNSIQSREVVDRATSFSFEAGIWRGQLFAGIPIAALTGSELEAVATSFLAAPENPDTATTTEDVYKAVQDYMSAYNAWALAGYPSSGALRNAVTSTQSILSTAAGNLVAAP